MIILSLFYFVLEQIKAECIMNLVFPTRGRRRSSYFQSLQMKRISEAEISFDSNLKRKFVGQHLFEIYEKYQPVKIIGEGKFGIVCSAMDKETKEKVAIKKIKNVFNHNKKIALHTIREIMILRHLKKHDFIVDLKDIIIPISFNEWKKNRRATQFNDVYLVFELMEMSLFGMIESNQILTEYHFHYILAQLLLGLFYMHSKSIIHRDLKTENILINTADYKLKICDFGWSRVVTKRRLEEEEDEEVVMTNKVVALWFRAPELLLGCPNYDASIDIWAVGCIFAELLGRKPMFPGRSPSDQLDVIISILGSPVSELFPNVCPLATDLLQKMFSFDPRKRIQARECLEHPYLKEFKDSNEDLKTVFDDIVANQNREELVDVSEGLLDIEKITDLLWKEKLDFQRESRT